MPDKPRLKININRKDDCLFVFAAEAGFQNPEEKVWASERNRTRKHQILTCDSLGAT